MTDGSSRYLLIEAAKRAANYLEALSERQVLPIPGSVPRLVQALDEPLPSGPTDAGSIIAFLDEYISPSTVAGAGGRYFGFVTGGALPVTLAANYLAGAWDQNCFSWVSSPAIASLEEVVLRWVKEALGIPGSAEGALVTGATMANFTCLAAARNWTLKQMHWDVAARGLFGAPEIAVVVGEKAHAVLFKALSMLGLGRDRVTRVPVDDQGRMRIDRLPKINGPTIICIQAGNVNSGAFDPARRIVEWAHSSGAWVHVDAAFGIWAIAAPEYAHLADGVVAADSWATDAHKWLNVPYDSGIAVVRNPSDLRAAMSISSAYLNPGERREPMQWGPESSRRARGVEVWAALRSLGRDGLHDLIERCCRFAAV